MTKRINYHAVPWIGPRVNVAKKWPAELTPSTRGDDMIRSPSASYSAWSKKLTESRANASKVNVKRHGDKSGNRRGGDISDTGMIHEEHGSLVVANKEDSRNDDSGNLGKFLDAEMWPALSRAGNSTRMRFGAGSKIRPRKGEKKRRYFRGRAIGDRKVVTLPSIGIRRDAPGSLIKIGGAYYHARNRRMR